MRVGAISSDASLAGLRVVGFVGIGRELASTLVTLGRGIVEADHRNKTGLTDGASDVRASIDMTSVTKRTGNA